jgi:hypothetical protein
LRDKIWFLVFVMSAALVLPILGGAAAATASHLCGLDVAGMLAAFAATAAFLFGAVLGVAGLLAMLLFSSP